MESNGLKVVFYKGKVRIYNYNQIIMIEKRNDNLYIIETKFDKQSCNYSATKDYSEVVKLWHRRFGHLGMKNINILIQKNLVNDLNDLRNNRIENTICEPCLLGKMTRQPFNKTGYRASKPLELVHTDLCGPITPISREGYKYFLIFIV